MSKKKYQIFISYRYVEEDGFVADELHKALIDFKVPRSLRKNLSNPEEYKIERLFQDKIKLSVAESLWDTIEEALSETEYLVVICSPRIDKNSWCYKEIETFINKNGTDKVIAVLAEGEPEDVIPDIMRADGKLPYAADVRGASKKEIKKHIQEAIPRIVAPIFGLEYEQLHNQFQEEIWSHKFKLMAGISAVVVAAAVFSTLQMLEARHQKAIQEQQLKKIEAQMQENLFQQEKILTLLAENDMEAGNYDSAIANLLKALPEDIEHPEYPIYNQACYDLSKALMLYENGSNYSHTKMPITDPETGRLIIPSKAIKIDENRMLLACDDTGIGYVWNINDGTAEFHIPIAFLDEGDSLAENYNYFFDKAGEKNIVIVDNILYISDAASIRSVSLDTHETLWTVSTNCTMALDVYDDIVVACNVGNIIVLRAKTGDVLSSKNNFNDTFENQKFRYAFLSKDKKSIVIRADYNTKPDYEGVQTLAGAEDLEANKAQLPAYLYRVRLDDLSLIEKKQLGAFISSSYWIDPNRDVLYTLECMNPSAPDNIPGQTTTLNKICAYEVDDFSERWSLDTESNVIQAYFFDNPQMKDKVYFVTDNTLIKVSVADGTYTSSHVFSSNILHLALNETSSASSEEPEYRLEALCSDSHIFVQADSSLSFLQKRVCDLPGTDGMFYRFGEKYILSYANNAYYYDIHKLESAYGTYIAADMIPELDEAYASSSANFNDEQFGIQLELRDENHVDILKDGNLIYTYSYEAGNLTGALITPDARFLFLMFGQNDTILINLEHSTLTEDDIIKLGHVDVKLAYMTNDPNEWIILSEEYGETKASVYVYDEANKTFEKFLFLQDFLTYDSKENMIYEYYGQDCMRVPLYSIKELIALAKNKK